MYELRKSWGYMPLPDVTEEMLRAEYWIHRLPREKTRFGHVSMAMGRMLKGGDWDYKACQQLVRNHSTALVDILHLAKKLADKAESIPFESFIVRRGPELRVLYDQFGEQLGSSFWDALVSNANFRNEEVVPRLAFAVRRAGMRRWPTDIKAFRTQADREFDQFQETALHTFEPTIVLAESQDGVWYYVISQTYSGWVLQRDVAFAKDIEEFTRYAIPQQFVVITKPNVTTEANPYDEFVSNQWIEFAAYVPLAQGDFEHLGQQSVAGHVVVEYPVRNRDGMLEVHDALLSTRNGVNEGFLPFGNETTIRLAFELLTERYGWGDSFGNHDCSSLVMDVFRIMGIQLPRNTNFQEKSVPHTRSIPLSATSAERNQLLSEVIPGVPLYMPGHTMIYLGQVNDVHYVIHDFAGYMKETDTGLSFVPVNEVMVSTLDIHSSQGRRYLEALTGILPLFESPS